MTENFERLSPPLQPLVQRPLPAIRLFSLKQREVHPLFAFESHYTQKIYTSIFSWRSPKPNQIGKDKYKYTSSVILKPSGCESETLRSYFNQYKLHRNWTPTIYVSLLLKLYVHFSSNFAYFFSGINSLFFGWTTRWCYANNFLRRIVESLTQENVEDSWTKSLCISSFLLVHQNWYLRGKCRILRNGTTRFSRLYIFVRKVASGKLLLKKVTNASMSCSVDKVKTFINLWEKEKEEKVEK